MEGKKQEIGIFLKRLGEIAEDWNKLQVSFMLYSIETGQQEEGFEQSYYMTSAIPYGHKVTLALKSWYSHQDQHIRE